MQEKSLTRCNKLVPAGTPQALKEMFKVNALFLIDGNSILRRAFHVRSYEHLSYNNEPTGALYGFFVMLSKLISEYKPSHLAVAFDNSRVVFRNQIYPEYKANRSATPETFIPQKAFAEECLDAFGITHYKYPNYEADDIIATLIRIVHEVRSNVLIRIVTGDKDLLQLVNSNTQVLYTVKGVSELDLYTATEMIAKCGYSSDKATDIKALKGDSADNIPGCPGIGEATAIDLISTYGSLEGVITQAATELKGKKWENIRSHANMLLTYKEITTLCTTVPITIKPMKLNLNLEAGYAKLKEYGIQRVRF